jgi:hypothetical protein
VRIVPESGPGPSQTFTVHLDNRRVIHGVRRGVLVSYSAFRAECALRGVIYEHRGIDYLLSHRRYGREARDQWLGAIAEAVRAGTGVEVAE